MSSYNALRDNYPMGFDGIEGQEEEAYLFELGGEAEVKGYSEKDAEEEFLKMTVRDLLERGMYLV